MSDVWPLVHAERSALIEDLERLDERSWEVPSLCPGWTVHDVVAHLVDTARTTRLGFLVGFARAGFDFDRQNARGVERERGESPRETLERLRRVAPRTSSPPAPLDTRLVEEVVHGETSGVLWGSAAPTRWRRSSGRSASRPAPRPRSVVPRSSSRGSG